MFSNSPEDMAARWILESGIQKISSDPKVSGGFNGWFDVSTNSYPFIYSEITGYGMSALVYLKTLKGHDLFLERAKDAAKWVIKNSITPEGGVLTRYYHDAKDSDGMYGFENQKVFAFDTGMVLYGLCNVALYDRDANINSCYKIADFLVSAMQKKNGEFHPLWDLKKNEPFSMEGKWSCMSGSYHAKLALGLIAMHQLTAEKKYLEAARRVCESSLKFQEGNGRFITHGNSTHMHPHCYSAEGLLYAGVNMGERKFIEASLKATNWAIRAQKESGGIPFLFENEKFSSNERTDVLAQVLRLSSIFAQMGRLDAEPRRLAALKNRLLEFQSSGGPQLGGIKFGFDFDGTIKNHLNSWCTMFSMQALFMHSQYKKGELINMNIIV